MNARLNPFLRAVASDCLNKVLSMLAKLIKEGHAWATGAGVVKHMMQFVRGFRTSRCCCFWQLRVNLNYGMDRKMLVDGSWDDGLETHSLQPAQNGFEIFKPTPFEFVVRLPKCTFMWNGQACARAGTFWDSFCGQQLLSIFFNFLRCESGPMLVLCHFVRHEFKCDEQNAPTPTRWVARKPA